MLLIQEISLSWNKKNRGRTGAEARKNFPLAYRLKEIAYVDKVMVHECYFLQNGNEFVDYAQNSYLYSSLEQLNLTNLLLQQKPDGLLVSFFYDENRSGMPYRRGHNQDYHKMDSPFYRKDCLNEVAFSLMPNQYGRVLYNERRRDMDTGEWYYQLHVYNLLYTEEKQLSKDVFVVHKPDRIYQQIARLY